jgi:hypothetical protein
MSRKGDPPPHRPAVAHPLAVAGLPLWLLLHALVRTIGPAGAIGVVAVVLVIQFVLRRRPGRW